MGKLKVHQEIVIKVSDKLADVNNQADNSFIIIDILHAGELSGSIDCLQACIEFIKIKNLPHLTSDQLENFKEGIQYKLDELAKKYDIEN